MGFTLMIQVQFLALLQDLLPHSEEVNPSQNQCDKCKPL